MTQEELLQEIINQQKIQEITLKEHCKKLGVLIEQLKDNEVSKLDSPLLIEYTLVANTSYQTNSVSIGDFRKMRIYVDAGFVANTTSGISVDVIYKNSVYLRDAVEIIASNGSAGNVSASIDVHHVDSVSLQIRNRDTVNDVVIKNLKVVLYQEL